MRVLRDWRAVLALVVLVPAVVLVANMFLGTESKETFCTAEGLLGPNGEIYGRSGSRNCQFVDGDGNLLLQTGDGQELCYGESSQVVSCDRPGARRPS